MSSESILYIGHSIFVSPEELQKIIEGKEITVDGACVPVIQSPDGSTTEPAGEMITKYSVKVGDKNELIGNNRGFKLFLVKPEDLLSSPKGCKWICFNFLNSFPTGSIIHQVVVQPEEVLLDSWMDRT